jgi:ribosomal-protein-alanine N-acetyltransferase
VTAEPNIPVSSLPVSSLPVSLRPAREDDVAQITAIEKLCFSDPWSASAFSAALTHTATSVAVAVINSAVVGYTVVSFAADEGELANLAVAPSVRKKGIGGALLRGVLRDALERQARRLFLEVRTSNVAARALYLGAGFREVGRRPRYYSGPVEDALIMMWEPPDNSTPAVHRRPELR